MLISVSRQKHQDKVLVIVEDYTTLYKVNEKWPGHVVLIPPALDSQTAQKFGSQGTAEVVFSRRGDALAAVKKYNDVQLDGKPMKIDIVGSNLQTAAPSGRPANANFNGAPRRGGQGRGGRGGDRGGGGGRGNGGGRGRHSGKGPAEKISAEYLDADLDKYHSGDMEKN